MIMSCKNSDLNYFLHGESKPRYILFTQMSWTSIVSILWVQQLTVQRLDQKWIFKNISTDGCTIIIFWWNFLLYYDAKLLLLGGKQVLVGVESLLNSGTMPVEEALETQVHICLKYLSLYPCQTDNDLISWFFVVRIKNEVITVFVITGFCLLACNKKDNL
jgi:hypothetical protein